MPRPPWILIPWAALFGAPVLGSQARDSGGIIDGPGGATLRRPMTIDDILALRRPSEVRVSPGGDRLAFIVTRADVERDVDETTLWVAPAAGGAPPAKVMEAPGLSHLAWTPDGGALTYVARHRGHAQVWRISARTWKSERLTAHRGLLVGSARAAPYALSPDGRYMAVTVWDSAAAAREVSAERRTGMVFSEALSSFAIGDPLFRLQPTELWLHDLQRGTARKVWESPGRDIAAGQRPELAWAPDSRRIAVLYPVSLGNGPRRLDLIAVPGGAVETLAGELGVSYQLRWAGDGASLRFMSEGPIVLGRERYRYRPYAYRLAAGVAEPLPPDPASDVEDTTEAVWALVERQSGDTVSGCSADRRRVRVACVREAPMTPPEVVVAEMQGDSLVRRPVTITGLNDALRNVTLGRVSRITFAVDDTTIGTAGLIEPVNRVPGKRHPLLVMSYRLFSGREFVGQAGWVTSWPAQVMAAHGHTVLLMNLPTSGLTAGQPDANKAGWLDRPIAAIRAAVDTVVARGLADSTRMGLLGWSYGSFVTDYVVTHYPEWFDAASSSEHGLSILMHYSRSGPEWRDQEDMFYGGSPYGEARARWQATAPVYSAHRLRAPVLLEYLAEHIDAVEFYTAIVREGGQAELVFYSNDAHVLEKPMNRRASMHRNLDWFDYWLLGRVDTDPAKREQYRRWDRMRERRDSRLAGKGGRP